MLLREELAAEGLDAGRVTRQRHLAAQGVPIPSTDFAHCALADGIEHDTNCWRNQNKTPANRRGTCNL